uniref:Uncharacterized protein n=1 Tax=Meloidogyne javanica TaxID=6303 RepID=A0A915MIA3_MELJA
MLLNRLFARCTCLSASQAICRRFSANATLVKSTQIPVKLKKEEIELELSNVLRNEENALQNVRPWQQLELLPIHNFKHVCLQKNFLFKRKKWDERRALMDPGVKLLRYPYTPTTPPPEYLDSSQWNDAFTSARIFLLGTKHDTIKSVNDVRLLMSAVHADFVFLGMSSSQAELLIGSNKLELMPKYSQESTEKFLVERLKKEGITDIPKALSKISVKAHLKNLHTLRQHCQKYMCKYSEFTFARNALPETIPGCAGFILGLPREEKLDRLVDLAEEFLIEHILLQLDPNRPPRIDYNHLDILLGWARDLIEWADYKESFSFKLEQENEERGVAYGGGKLLQEDPFKKAANWFDKFMDETFPDGRQAMILRQNREMVKNLQTLIHRGTIEKLAAAQRQNVDHFEPLTVIAIVGHRHVPGICEIWERPEEKSAARLVLTVPPNLEEKRVKISKTPLILKYLKNNWIWHNKNGTEKCPTPPLSRKRRRTTEREEDDDSSSNNEGNDTPERTRFRPSEEIVGERRGMETEQND